MHMVRIVTAAAAAASLLSGGTVADRVSNSMFEYVFRRAECLAGYARDSNDGATAVFGDLHINTTSIICKGLGVEAKPGGRVGPRIISDSNASRVVQAIDEGHDGWTFEIWASFGNFSDCPSCEMRHIASIGSANKSFAGGACAGASNILFMQQNFHHSVAMEERSWSGWTECKDIPAVAVIDWGVPVHVVFTSTSWGFGTSSNFDQDYVTTRWYFNGLLVHVQEQPNVAAQWQADFHLKMLSDAVEASGQSAKYAPARGSIFLVAMYSWPLNDDEVVQNFDSGLENSPPVAEDIVITINEDGEIGNHYETPECYLQDDILTLNLSIICLRVTDIDQQEGFPGFDPNEKVLLPTVFIDSLPSSGILLDAYGHTISDVPHTIRFDGGYRVGYRPGKDESSGAFEIYASFAYGAVDGVTGERSVALGVVDIHVLPKNDPPLPNDTYVTVSMGRGNIIFLDGIDVDTSSWDAIQGILVVELPAHGVLYQVLDNETSSDVKVKDGDRLSGQYVSYTYTGNVSQALNTSHEELLIHDMFTFRLYDSFDALSTLGIASLAIVSRLKAVTAQSRNDSSWICVEDFEGWINLHVQDSADLHRIVRIVISAVPENGSLLRVGNGSALALGDTLNTTCSKRICATSIWYVPNRNYFNSPASKWNGDVVSGSHTTENFRFYAIATDSGERSNEAVQEIRVINSNDPSDIRCPEEPQHILAAGTSVYTSGTDFVPLDRTTLRGFLIIDPDKGVDIVKVKLSAKYGLVSLNGNYISLLDFNSIAYCYEAEASQCSGSGTNDNALIFLAEPSQAQMALEGMVYQSLRSNVIDSINITVLDGANGECLDETKFRADSIRQRCWRTSCQFNVIVSGPHSGLTLAPDSAMSVQLWASAGVSLFILAFLSCGRFLRAP